MFKVGFDNDLYIQKQSEQISKRIKEFGGKLYLEFGGKLFDDYHASRVLPGFKPDSKLQMLLSTIAEKIDHPINPGNRKVIIFTAFCRTAGSGLENRTPVRSYTAPDRKPENRREYLSSNSWMASLGRSAARQTGS